MPTHRNLKWIKAGLQGLFLFVPLTSANADVSGGTNDPKMMFEKMLNAKNDLAYKGIVAYEFGDQMHSYAIESNFSGKLPNSMIPDSRIVRSLNGPEQVYDLGSGQNCVQIPEASAEELSDWYNFSYVEPRRVAGREAHEITLRPVDPYRLAYSFVIDQDTGLMLRSVAMLPDRRVLERIEFIDLDVLRQEQVEQLETPEQSVSELAVFPQEDEGISYEVEMADAGVLESIEDGAQFLATETEVQAPSVAIDQSSQPCDSESSPSPWALSWVPEGFELVSNTQTQHRAALVYADGLSSFSLFVVPIDQFRFPAGHTQRGATTLAINYYGVSGRVYMATFVGEVPQDTAELVLKGLDRQL